MMAREGHGRGGNMVGVHNPPPTFYGSRDTNIALGLVLLATWLRLWQLDSIPPGLWFDEGFNGMEAVEILEKLTWPVFILRGQGREVLFHYLLAISFYGLGQMIYVVRLVPALLGIVSIPIMYRWGLSLFKGEAGAAWIALIGTAGLATSFWYLVMSRVGYRANTLLPVLLLTCYLFWRGWQTGKIRYFVAAGLGVGLCQYTYLAGRLVPLIFIAFVFGQMLLSLKKDLTWLKNVWLGLLLMAGAAILAIMPLFLFFKDYPELIWERGGDVSLEVSWTSSGLVAWVTHLVSAGRVFIDGQDPNWRHHFLGRPVFSWFSTLGFWIGLVVALRRIRRPAYLFLLSMLFVMWLPAPLSEPAVHTLRLVGILPAYYVLVALGLLTLFNWGKRRFSIRLTARQTGLATLLALLLINGVTTLYYYFFLWAERPEVYQAYDGPVVDLAHYLVAAANDTEVVIPYYLYTHASMRFILDSSFEEAVLLPQNFAENLERPKNVPLVVPEYPEDDGKPPAYVWLRRMAADSGTATVSAVNREISLAHLLPESADPIEGSLGQVIARRYQVDPQTMLSLFPRQMPRKRVAVQWADNLRLTGYEFVPGTIEAGEDSTLYLAWDLLGYTGLQQMMFLQLLDSRGIPVGQTEVEPISRKMYRWRDDNLILEQHSLKIDPGLGAGLYFVRLGFFEPQIDQRLPTYGPDGERLGEELIVGPLYVQAGGIDPVASRHRVQAKLGNGFELLGYSVYPSEFGDATEIELVWKTRQSVERNYTVSVQLLDSQNQIIAQADAQPLPNIYPTSSWQPGDIIADRFVLPIAEDDLLDAGRLVTGMYDLSAGVGDRLPAYNQQGELLPDGLVPLDN